MADTQLTSQQILNRVFVNTTSRIAVNTDTGDNRPVEFDEQSIWNRIFDNTNSVINLSMS